MLWKTQHQVLRLNKTNLAKESFIMKDSLNLALTDLTLFYKFTVPNE